jgi:hypothetical protein
MDTQRRRARERSLIPHKAASSSQPTIGPPASDANNHRSAHFVTSNGMPSGTGRVAALDKTETEREKQGGEN